MDSNASKDTNDYVPGNDPSNKSNEETKVIDLSFDELREEVDKITESVNMFYKSLKNRKSADENIIFIGSTGTGKSTLINYLAGKELRVIEDEYLPWKYNIQIDQPLDYIRPGSSTFSETKMPGRWVSDFNKAYWDCPGFEDTDGPVQEIINAFYVKGLFNKSLNVKVVLLVQEEVIFCRKHNRLLYLTDALAKLNLIDSLESVALIITQWGTYDVQKVTKLLEERILQDASDKNLIKFAEFYKDNKNQIALFPKPKNIGSYGNGYAEVIKISITELDSMKNKVELLVTERATNWAINEGEALNGQIKVLLK